MAAYRKLIQEGLLLLILLVLTACAGKGADGGSTRSVFHLDANLGFAIKHPQDWQRSGPAVGQERPTLTWSSPAGRGKDLTLTVTALDPREVVGGFDGLLKTFLLQEPAFTVNGDESLELPDAPARRLTGSTPTRTWLLLLVTSTSRAYILTASAPPEAFEAHRELFADLLESFRIMD